MNFKGIKIFIVILIPILLFTAFFFLTNNQNKNNTVYAEGTPGLLYSEFQIDDQTYYRVSKGSVSNDIKQIIIPETYNGYPVTEITSNGFEFLYSLNEIIIPNSITTISDGAFRDCPSLKNIVIPNNVTTIGNYSFYNCQSLSYIDIPSSVTSIGDAAFYNCTKLTSIMISSSVTNVGSYAFYNCSNLNYIRVLNPTPFILKTNVFNNTNNCPIYVPYVYVNDYKIANGWSKYSNRIFEDFFDQLKFKLNENIEYEVSVNDEIIFDNIIQIIIPETYTGYPVTKIADNGFKNLSSLEEVIIPNSITIIGNSAFYNCAELISVVFETDSQLTSIGDSAFSGCSLLADITIPSSVISIGASAFYNCVNLIKITIPNGITKIKNYMFRECYNLKSITIPASVNEIYSFAFYDCINLNYIRILNPIPLTLGSGAFDMTNDCPIFVPYTSVEAYQSSNWNGAYKERIVGSTEGLQFILNGNEYEVSKGNVVANVPQIIIPEFYNGLPVTKIANYGFESLFSLEEIIIPNSLMVIGTGAFVNCSNLTTIAIPNNTTIIGDNAFSGCSNLADIMLPNNITNIGNSTFEGCTSLTSITIPTSVTNIRSSAFRGCIKLVEINFMETSQLVSIEDNAFRNCSKLNSIIIPDSVISIGESAFKDCIKLVSVLIPNKVTNIGIQAFSGCTSLANIDVDSGNLNYSSLSGILFDKNKTVLIQYPNGKAETSYTIPNSVTVIKDYAFSDCTKIITIIILEESQLTNIEDYAFSGCANLASIIIPDSVINIGSYAFDGCSKLKTNLSANSQLMNIGSYAFNGCNSIIKIRIPNTVMDVGENIFHGCSELKEIRFLGITPFLINPGFFDDCHENLRIIVPTIAVEDYKIKWVEYSEIIEKDEFTIIFDTQGGNLIDDLTEVYENAIMAPNNPTKEGYRFIGWFLKKDFVKCISDILNSEDYEKNKNFYDDYIDNVIMPAFPLHAKSDGEVFVFDTMPCMNFTLIAVWELKNWEEDKAERFVGGDGTEQNPYEISTAEELAYLAYLVNNSISDYATKYYKLVANINLAGKHWTPIGVTVENSFKGIFNGNNYKILNLTFNGYYNYNSIPLSNYLNHNFDIFKDYSMVNNYSPIVLSLFGVTENANLLNIEIENNNVDLYTINSVIIASLVGISVNTSVSNCSSSGEQNINLVSGHFDNQIHNIVSGLIGFFRNIDTVNLENIFNASNININSINLRNQDITTICGLGYFISGITVNIKNCYNLGNINLKNVGIGTVIVSGISWGIFGDNLNITESYNSGKIDITTSPINLIVNGLFYGLVGENLKIFDSYNQGNLKINGYGSELQNVSGFAMLINFKFLQIESCYNSGNIEIINANTFDEQLGGIAGFVGKIISRSVGVVNKSFNSGDISIINYIEFNRQTSDPDTYITGFITFAIDVIISECYNSGNIIYKELEKTTNIYAYISSFGNISLAILNSYNSGDIEIDMQIDQGWVKAVAIGYHELIMYNTYNIGNLIINGLKSPLNFGDSPDMIDTIVNSYNHDVEFNLKDENFYPVYQDYSPENVIIYDSLLDFSKNFSMIENYLSEFNSEDDISIEDLLELAGNYSDSFTDAEDNITYVWRYKIESIHSWAELTVSISNENKFIFYSLKGDFILGWDFKNVWTINENFNNGYPILKNAIRLSLTLIDRQQTKSIYNYGHQILLPTPNRIGYKFLGWFDNAEFEGSSIIEINSLENNLILYARWEVNTYNITFRNWDDTKNLDSQIIEYGEEVTPPTIPNIEGHTFSHWSLTLNGETPFTEFNNITNDLVLYPVYLINQFTIMFESNGGSSISAITKNYGSEIVLSNPNKEGYTFLGWYDNAEFEGAIIEKVESLKKDLILYARWEINTYNIVFRNWDDTENLDFQIVEYGENVISPTAPNIEGYTFSHWSLTLNGEIPFIEFNNVTDNIFIYAVYISNEFIITFESKGGTLISSIMQVSGTEITLPSNPHKEDYEFAGWYLDEKLMNPFNLEIMPEKNMTLYAKWSITKAENILFIIIGLILEIALFSGIMLIIIIRKKRKLRKFNRL